MPDWFKMKTLLLYKAFILLFFVAYSAVAVTGNFFAPKKEVFPFFSWSLFSYVSDTAKQFELEIIEIDQIALDRPTYFYELRSEFRAANRRDVTLAKLLQRLALAQQSGDSEETEGLRRVLEESYLNDRQQIRYRIVLTRFHPIERWLNGRVRSKKELGRFEARFE